MDQAETDYLKVVQAQIQNCELGVLKQFLSFNACATMIRLGFFSLSDEEIAVVLQNLKKDIPAHCWPKEERESV